MKSKKITKFVSTESKLPIITDLIQTISKNAKISISLAEKYTNQTISEWETQTHQNLESLFFNSYENRAINISTIIGNIRTLIRPLIPSYKHLEHTMSEVSLTFEDYFKLGLANL